MSRFAGLFTVLAIVAIAGTGINAQSSSVVCESTYVWMDNTRGQNPCLVAAYAQGACNGGEFTVDPLAPDTHYTGPYVDQVNPCQCSTIVFSLVSACGVCQNRTIETWSSWNTNCTTVYTGIFPETIPTGTAIPAWAYLDVVTSDNFDPAAALADDTAPESSASSKPTGTISSTVSSTASAPNSVTGTPSPSPSFDPTAPVVTKKKSNAGAIAGGVVGGLIALALVAGLALWWARRNRNSSTPSAAYAHSDAGPTSPMAPMTQHQSYAGAGAGGFGEQQRPYDPQDPSTFPHSPGTPTIHTTHSGMHPYGQQAQPGQYSGVPEL